MSPTSSISRLDGNLPRTYLYSESVVDKYLLHPTMMVVINSLSAPPLKATSPQLASLVVFQPSQYGLTARFFPADVLAKTEKFKAPR